MPDQKMKLIAIISLIVVFYAAPAAYKPADAARYYFYLDIFSCSAIFYLSIRESIYGLFLSASVLLHIVFFQYGFLPYNWILLMISYDLFMTVVGFTEKRKLEGIKAEFVERFTALKYSVSEINRETKVLSLRLEDTVFEIDDTERQYGFSKMLENVITKDELLAAVKGGFERIGFDADFIFYSLTDSSYKIFFSNIEAQDKLKNILNDNMWLTRNSYVELMPSDSHWQRYWGKIFPLAQRICIYQMKVTDDKLGFIVYIFNKDYRNTARVVSLSNEITLGMKKVMLYEKVSELSRRDSLTGLYGRRYFFERLEEELRRAKRYNTGLAFVMADLDYFKKINDTYGHAAGDLVLSSVSRIINESISNLDFAGRYGGEEFCIMLVNYSIEDTIKICSRIRERVQKEKIRHNDQTIAVTISIGISFYPDSGQDSSMLIRKADIALYDSKTNGRDTITIASNKTSAK